MNFLIAENMRFNRLVEIGQLLDEAMLEETDMKVFDSLVSAKGQIDFAKRRAR